MEEEKVQPCELLTDDKLAVNETELDGGVRELETGTEKNTQLTPKALMEKINNLQKERKTKKIV